MEYVERASDVQSEDAPAPASAHVEFGTADVETEPSIVTGLGPGIGETLTSAPQDTFAPGTLSAASVVGPDVTVHQVRLGPDVQEIEVARSAGVQVGDHNRQLNHYQFRIDRPEVSLDRLLEGNSVTQRSFERLVANPDSWIANYVFRHHLSAGPAAPGNGVLFADTARTPTMRIGAHIDEHGTTVVDSRGVQVAGHSFQRNDFSYKLTRQEISPDRMLHDHPDLARSLAMTIRHPDNPAVQRSFIHQFSEAYADGGAPSLRILDQDLPSGGLSVQQSAGVQIGIANTRADRLSVDIRRMALTGWEPTAEGIAAKLDEPAPAPQAIDGPDYVRPAEPYAASQAPEVSSFTPFGRYLPAPEAELDLGPSISPFD